MKFVLIVRETPVESWARTVPVRLGTVTLRAPFLRRSVSRLLLRPPRCHGKVIFSFLFPFCFFGIAKNRGLGLNVE